MKKPLLIIAGIIAFGLLTLGGLTFFALFGGRGTTSYNSVSIEKEVEAPPEMTLRSFRQLRGTKYFIAEITTSGGGSSYSSYSSGRWFEFGDGGGGLIRNLVFLDSESLLSHTLFEDNHSYIINMVSFPPQPPQSSSDEEPGIVPIRWFVYEVAHQDTNQDGELNREDARTIGVSDVDGTRYQELIEDVLDIYNLTMLESGELLAIYRQGGGRFATTIDLQAQEIIQTQQLPDLEIGVE
jgi:hypothetical protein